MSRFMCIVQAGSNADDRRNELERALRAAHEGHHPGEPTSVAWMAVPPGEMFTEGERSTSSIDVTGAPPSFVHALFTEDHDGRLPDGDVAVVNGTIRAGRNDEQKAEIASRLDAARAALTGVDVSSIRTSTRDIGASITMEGGVLLPEPGSEEEAAWVTP